MLGAAAPPPMPEATAEPLPEVAAPTSPPPLTAEPELAEANGGDAAEAPARAEPRWILVWVADAAEPEQPLTIAFRAGAVHEIAVAIGPNQEGAIAAVGGRPFDEELGEVADMEELTVTFVAPSISMQQKGSVFLPRTGTSRRVTFAVKLPADLERFDAEIRVHHKNRIVQMARLSGPVVADPAQAPPGSRIELEVATMVPENVDLSSRAGADAGIVRTDAGTTAIAGEDFLGFDDDRLGRVVREGNLLEVLTGLATSDASRQRRLEDAVDDLRALVFQGCELYPVIGQPLVESLAGRPLDRLEVLVDERSDFFPLELVYDLPAPAKDATLCRGWKTALKKGACTRQHEAKEASSIPSTFCPSGFWGLSKVIERRVVGHGGWRRAGAPEGFEIAVRLDPTTERDTLESPRKVLFAASDKVDEVKRGRHRERPEDARSHRATQSTFANDVGRVGRRRRQASHAARAPLAHDGGAVGSGPRDRRRRDVPRRSAPARRSCARRRTTPRSSSCSAAIPPSPTSCRASSPASRTSVRLSSWAQLPRCSASEPRRLRARSPRRSPRQRSGGSRPRPETSITSFVESCSRKAS